MFYKLGEQCIYWLWVLVQLACCPSQWLDVHVRYHVSDESLQLIMTLSSRPPSAFFPRSASSVLTQPPDGAVISGHPTAAKQNTRPARLHTRADEHSGGGRREGAQGCVPMSKDCPWTPETTQWVIFATITMIYLVTMTTPIPSVNKSWSDPHSSQLLNNLK